jgi:lipopolysaccharide export system ATP-binding protein
MHLLEVHRLVKSYGTKTVVNQVSFCVDRGEIVGLLGPNGAGKTTSFRMTVGMIRPDGGTVHLNGEDVTDMPMYRRARLGMGYLSQEPSVFQRMSVGDNLMAILETLPLRREEMRRRCRQMLEEAGLDQVARQKAYTLSGGERRRLEITRALVTSPSLLLLDEPFSGVDPKRVSELQKTISAFRDQGIGILLTDHNVRDTLKVTDRAYIIHDGVILRHGTPQEIVDDPQARELYLGDDFNL